MPRAGADFQLFKIFSQQFIAIGILSSEACAISQTSAECFPLIVLKYNVSLKTYLEECANLGYFNHNKKWLILLSTAQYETLLWQPQLRLDSNVQLAVYNSSYIKLVNVYQMGQTLHEQYIGEWRNDSLCIRGAENKYSKTGRGNLQGYQLQTATVEINKFYITVNKTEPDFQIAGGYFGEMFLTMAEFLNFTYALHYVPGYSYGNPTPKNKTWTGMLGMLQRHEVDITCCEVSLIANRLDVVSFTFPLHTSARKLFLKKGVKELRMSWYLRPFALSTWCVILVTLGVYIVLETALDPSKALLSHTFSIFSILLLQGSEEQSIWSKRLLLLTVSLLSLIINAAYNAKLTSIFTTYTPKPQLQDLDDILTSNTWRLGTVNSSLPHDIFQRADANSTLGKLWNRKIKPYPQNFVPDFQSGLRRTLSDDHYVFMGLEDACMTLLQQEFTSSQACQILPLAPKYFAGVLGLAMQHNSSYREVINLSLLRLRSSGIMKRLYIEWVPGHQVCHSSTFNNEAEWIDVAPFVIVFLSGAILSIVMLGFEILYFKIKFIYTTDH